MGGVAGVAGVQEVGENIGIASFGLRILRKNERLLFCNF
jgi:hypothetical protein